MKAITVGTKMTLTRNYNARLLQTNGRTLTLSAGSVVRVKQVSGLVDDSRVHGVNISCMIPEGHIVVTEIHNGWDTFNSMIVPISALRDETEDVAALEAGAGAEKQSPAFEVGKKYYTRTFSGRHNAGADITVVGITDKFVKFYDTVTGGITKRKIKTGEGYQHFACDYGRHGSYTTSWFEVQLAGIDGAS